MLRGLGALRWLGAALVLGMGVTFAQAQDVTILQNTDLPGSDYDIIRDTDLDSCSAACAGDNICQAFTFNEKSNWCFLKSAAGEEAQFNGAVSGRINRATSAAVIEAERQAELPFPAQNLIDEARSFAQSLPQTDPRRPRPPTPTLWRKGMMLPPPKIRSVPWWPTVRLSPLTAMTQRCGRHWLRPP